MEIVTERQEIIHLFTRQLVDGAQASRQMHDLREPLNRLHLAKGALEIRSQSQYAVILQKEGIKLVEVPFN